MFLKALTLLLAIGASRALVPEQPRIHADRTMLDFMIESRAIGDPANQQRCFNKYLPTLKAVADQYEADYNICVDSYATEIKRIDSAFSAPYNDITKSAQATCQALNKCTSYARLGEAFDCYAKTGSEQSKVLFTLSGVATENAVQIKLEYFRVENVADACVRKAESDYWQNTSNTQDELQKCLGE